jgi:hypothetical protein
MYSKSTFQQQLRGLLFGGWKSFNNFDSSMVQHFTFQQF